MSVKTNAMRILDKNKINYKTHSYAHTDAISGVEVAAALGQAVEQVFKTLVTIGKSGNYYVFVVPAGSELDLKKAASSVDEKAIQMLKSKDLLPLTGYIHGGCSPIGMKKQLQTVIDESASQFQTIIVSAGKIGYQAELSLEELRKVVPFELYSLTV